jgi:hypothetical protein
MCASMDRAHQMPTAECENQVEALMDVVPNKYAAKRNDI